MTLAASEGNPNRAEGGRLRDQAERLRASFRFQCLRLRSDQQLHPSFCRRQCFFTACDVFYSQSHPLLLLWTHTSQYHLI